MLFGKLLIDHVAPFAMPASRFVVQSSAYPTVTKMIKIINFSSNVLPTTSDSTLIFRMNFSVTVKKEAPIFSETSTTHKTDKIGFTERVLEGLQLTWVLK